MPYNYTPLEERRLEKLTQLRAQGVDPYPNRSERSHTSNEALLLFEKREAEGLNEVVGVTLAGRIRSLRAMGKILFAHIEDTSGRIQLFFRENDVGQEQLVLLKTLYDLGDFIQTSGTLFRTRSGEVTLRVESFKMLAKAISPLPAAKDEIKDDEVIRHATLDDPETRYRQRYADLAINTEVRDVFRTRAAVVQALRTFLDQRGFLEVETPILQPIYGGAAAKPFTTHHNQLKQDLYLRISFELYLKRLLVGGLERVYEIGRDFRNEGVDRTHNPEFTMLEYYWAYADYQDIMRTTEEMITFVTDRVIGSRKVQYQGQEIDVTPPWRRIELNTSIKEAIGVDITRYPDAPGLAKALRKTGLEIDPSSTRGKLIDTVISSRLEPGFIQPTILYNYPREISPLSKSIPGDPNTVERFEAFLGGMEICNAFTELNDPLDQETRFVEMGRTESDLDEEKHPLDEDYLRAMRYGMPPNGGFGMGIDRLVMFLSDCPNIREVILFPHLRTRE